MCMQMTVLRKIRKAGEMNGYAIDLAEAQAKDYVMLKNEVKNIKDDVTAIKTEQAVQGGKIDLILQRLNGPVEDLKKKGIVAEAIMPFFKSWKFWCLLVIAIMIIALAGERVINLIGWIPTTGA